MRRIIAPLLAAALWTCGCAQSHGTSGGQQGPTPPNSVPTSFNGGSDRDDDSDHNDDDARTLYFGKTANATDRRESIALVQSYYAAATSGDGATACRLLVPFVAEALPERVGRQPNATCAQALSRQFARHHRQLVAKRATMSIVAVRVEGDHGLVLIAFPAVREVRQMVERRVHDRWRLLNISDGIIE